MEELKVYDKWEEVPDNIKTKTSLGKMGLKLAKDQQPIAKKRHWHRRRGQWFEGFYDLYAVEDAEPKREMSDAQKAALAKAQKASQNAWFCTSCNERLTQYEKNHGKQCSRCRDLANVISNIKELFADGDFVVFDTETTGLEGEILEIGIIDNNGRTLMNQRLNPISEIEAEATAVHGLTAEILKDEPRFLTIYDELVKILTSAKRVVIFNVGFDVARLYDTCILHNLEPIEFKKYCAMEAYAVYCGDYSYQRKSYWYYPLPDGDHTAIGDCKATLALLEKMVKNEDENE